MKITKAHLGFNISIPIYFVLAVFFIDVAPSVALGNNTPASGDEMLIKSRRVGPPTKIRSKPKREIVTLRGDNPRLRKKMQKASQRNANPIKVDERERALAAQDSPTSGRTTKAASQP